MGNNLQIDYRYITKENLKNWLLRTDEEGSSEIKNEEIVKTDFYTSNRNIFDAINNADLLSNRPLLFSNIFSAKEDYLLAAYYSNIEAQHPAYVECKNEIEYLNSHIDLIHFPIRIQMSKRYEISEDKKNLILKPNCRQWNKLCNKRNRRTKERDEMMASQGFVGFDIHSTIFSLARYLNTGEFDIDWDIKTILYPDYSLLKKLPEKKEWLEQFKNEVLMRSFFEENLQSAWFGYMTNNFTLFSYEEFKHIYEEVQKIIGGSEPYQGNIFIIESLWELKIIHELVARGCEVRNVYDCFYFKPDQISEDDVKQIITDKIYELKDFI